MTLTILPLLKYYLQYLTFNNDPIEAFYHIWELVGNGYKPKTLTPCVTKGKSDRLLDPIESTVVANTKLMPCQAKPNTGSMIFIKYFVFP